MKTKHTYCNTVSDESKQIGWRKLSRISVADSFTRIMASFMVVTTIISLSGCSSHGVRAPKANLPKLPHPATSTVAASIEIPTATIAKSIEQEAKKQRYSGTTGPMGIRFQAERAIDMAKISYTTTVQVPKIVTDWVVDKVVSKIPIIGDVIKEVKRKVEKTVLVPVDKLVEKEVKLADIRQFDNLPGFKLVNKYVSWVEDKIETKGQLNYRADFDKVNEFSFHGDVLKIQISENWHISADLLNPIPGTRVKGALAVDGQSTLSVNAKIHINNDGSIACNLDNASLRYDTSKLAIPGIHINLADALKIQNHIDVQKHLMKRAIEFAVSKFVLQKIISGKLKDVSLTKKAREFADELKGQKAIKEGIYLDLAPSSVTIGQPYGADTAQGNELFVPVGIATPIRLAFVGTNHPAPASFDQIKEVPVSIADSVLPKFDLQIAADVSTDALAESLRDALSRVWKEKGYEKYGFTLGKPEIYPTINVGKPGVAVVIILLKNGKPDTYLSAIGVPKLSATKGSPVNNLLSFADLAWSAESENFIIKQLAWLAENLAYKYVLGKLAESAKFPLDHVHNEIKKHNPVHVEDDKIAANFDLQSWNIKDAQVGDGFIRVEAIAQGTPTIRIK